MNQDMQIPYVENEERFIGRPRPYYGRPFYGRPFYGRPRPYYYGAPFVGGVLGGLLGSTFVNPYFYGGYPYYPYVPYGGWY
ncbi:hypothetical protein [Metabacillus malikii]|uniref:Spore coat protein n=1 Tax=Metabacillus malikii TaxID=1504265 RepID=A0ABT9Z9N8_9BACI|nr:hypothetical protein [Metabacillus malikii]MDQ0228957.1 hypothetical protein [Metabacillus malikii]